MKPILTVGIACSLLLGTVAVAQTSAPEPSNQGQPMQANPPSAEGSTSGSSTTPGTKANDATVQACKQQAAAKKLTGQDKTQFMKDCKAGKTSREGR
jgi:psiF repeat-containing protein